ncbi:MAG TPA: pilus assembly protein TadG-related protein, partial [Candidatus Limnocylindrales bacterium]|nr:pilus assembly protein TadG-related protein [Candidatus Limnocylindrales bacterium]
MSLNMRSAFALAQPRYERGQVLAIGALFLVVLLGFTALAVDYGTYLLARRQYQNIADAASLAGSVHMTRPITNQDRADARTAAWESLRRQMGLTFAPSGNPPTGDTGQGAPYQENGWSIWVDVPPSAAGSDYPGSTSISGSTSVFVRVERQNPAFFARFFEIDGRQIRAWATAGNLPSRWAVIGLCPRNHPDCPANVESIVLAGTNTALRVIDGD